MTPARPPLWRVRFDADAWDVDLRAVSTTARERALQWRRRIETAGGIPHADLKATRAEDDGGVPLPGCVKTRIPYPDDDDPRRSPWGAVLRAAIDDDGLYLSFLAFGLRHPAAGNPSVYQRAHRRLLGS